MRIGLILPELAGGGAEITTLRLASGLLGQNHLIDLLLLRPSGIYYDAIPPGVRVFYPTCPFHKVSGAHAFLASVTQRGHFLENLPISLIRRYRDLRALRRRWPEGCITSRSALYGACVAKYLLRVQPQAVFAALHLANSAAVCGKMLSGAKTHVTISLHNNLSLDYHEDELSRARSLYREADAVIAASKGVANEAARTVGLDRKHITTIFNPIPTMEIVTASAQSVEHPWFGEDQPPVVLTVGRAAPQKDHLTLVRAFALLRRSIAARLVILCDMDALDAQANIQETRNLAISLNIAEHVTHLDFDENPFRYMKRAGVVAISSRWEGFCNVLPEAMACGTPVVSTDAPYGPAEILEGGKWGPLVPVGDTSALAKAIASILAGHHVSRKKLKKRAATFSIERIVPAYEKLFSPPLMNLE